MSNETYTPIELAVEFWHSDFYGGDKPLHEHLGMTTEAYAKWVANPQSEIPVGLRPVVTTIGEHEFFFCTEGPLWGKRRQVCAGEMEGSLAEYGAALYLLRIGWVHVEAGNASGDTQKWWLENVR